MSFVSALALAVGLLIVLPLVAHLLRRGKTEEHEFPAAALVPEKAITARQRSRLEDRVLFSLRALAVLALALLGATPLLRCSRLSVDRPAGASIALALVIDDSQSMQSKVSEGARWELALAGARQLLASARTGDAIALVLAGRPARVALSPTPDLGLVKKTLTDLQVTDRSTDIGNAVRLAQGLLKSLPQVDKRVVVLSDLADDIWVKDDAINVSAPLEVLREQVDNCAVIEAVRHSDSIEFQVACTTALAAEGRKVSGVVTESSEHNADAGAASPKKGSEIGSVALAPQPGAQSLRFDLKSPAGEHEITLTPGDANLADDRAVVTGLASAFTVAVVADSAKAGVITGGATVIEQALIALDHQIIVKPLTLLPETPEQLQPFAALIIDDPPGLSPEARVALDAWLMRGGVALGLLGPATQAVQLSSNLEPFAKGGQWQRLEAALSVSETSATWLPSDKDSLKDMTRTGRVRLDGAEPPGSVIAQRWEDGVPLVLDRAVGSGAVLTVGLPAAVEVSDLALRPIFLSILGRVVEQAKARRGPVQSVVGTPWYFSPGASVQVSGPRGLIPVVSAKLPAADGASTETLELRSQVTPELAGPHLVKVEGQTQRRVVTIEPDEVLRAPMQPPEDEQRSAGSSQGEVDISREVALALLALLCLELLVRGLGPLIRGKAQFS